MGRMLGIKAAVVKFGVILWCRCGVILWCRVGVILWCRFGVILWCRGAKGKFTQLSVSYNTPIKAPKTKSKCV